MFILTFCFDHRLELFRPRSLFYFVPQENLTAKQDCRLVPAKRHHQHFINFWRKKGAKINIKQHSTSSVIGKMVDEGTFYSYLRRTRITPGKMNNRVIFLAGLTVQRDFVQKERHRCYITSNMKAGCTYWNLEWLLQRSNVTNPWNRRIFFNVFSILTIIPSQMEV